MRVAVNLFTYLQDVTISQNAHTDASI